ncbi:MAG: hypothetical protein R3F61_08420 [Myxococcota bacterium]
MPRSPAPSDSAEIDLPPEDEPSDLIGGLLAMEAADELALGGVEDYGTDEASLGLDGEDGPVFGLSFATERHEPTGAWDLAEVADLVVNETRGRFEADGGGRNDVVVMEEDFDDDDEVVVAVWEPETPGGAPRVGARVRRRQVLVPKQYIPYGLIAAGLGALLLVAVMGIVAVITIGVLSGPRVEVRPLDPEAIPKVEIERKPVEEKTADEILEEVLGEDGAK